MESIVIKYKTLEGIEKESNVLIEHDGDGEYLKLLFTNKLSDDDLKMIESINKSGYRYTIEMDYNNDNDNIPLILENYSNKFGKFKRISLLYSFMKMTTNLSNRSTCIRKKVGCIIAPSNFENILSIGYNGSLPGAENGCHSIESGKCGCIHAEMNALNKLKCEGYDDLTLLCTLSPCMNCSKEILKFPIKKVVYLNSYRDLSGVNFLLENQIKVYKYDSKDLI